MFNLFSRTVRADLILMIQSIFLWLRANPSLLCQAWNIHTPAVAGLQEEFLTAAAAFKQSDSLSLLRTVCSWNHNLTTTHVEIFYLREITGVSSPFFFLFLSDFDARCCLLSSLSQHSPNLLHISFGARCKSCRRRYGSASRSADNQRRDDSFVWI